MLDLDGRARHYRHVHRLLIPLGLLAAIPAGARTLPPADECARDATFVATRAKLAQAVARRDRTTLLTLVHPDIKWSFGGGGGKRDFAANWKLDRPEAGSKSSPIWAELSKILPLGCARVGSGIGASMQMPHLFTRLPATLDPFEHVMTLHANVLRTAASASAPIVPTPRYTLVKTRGDATHDWFAVTTPSGLPAFARRTDVRSPVDYRIIFERRQGKWLIAAFVAGD